MSNTLKVKINNDIKKLAVREKFTKQVLGTLSRDILEYVCQSQDIGTVNRLLAVLTPENHKAACLFFNHFLEWTFNKDTHKFENKMKGEKKLKEYEARRLDFLKEEHNTIWTWSLDNIKTEKRETDWAVRLTNTVKSAIDKGNMTPEQVMTSVLAGGITLDEFMTMAKAASEQVKTDQFVEGVEEVKKAA